MSDPSAVPRYLGPIKLVHGVTPGQGPLSGSIRQ